MDFGLILMAPLALQGMKKTRFWNRGFAIKVWHCLTKEMGYILYVAWIFLRQKLFVIRSIMRYDIGYSG